MGVMPFVSLPESSAVFILCNLLWSVQITYSAKDASKFECTDCFIWEAGATYQRCEAGCNDGFFKSKSYRKEHCVNKMAYLEQVTKASQIDRNTTGKSRRKRQVLPDTPPTKTTTTTTTSTTPPVEVLICRPCSLQWCNKCRDDVDPPSCGRCLDGYTLDNNTHTCVGSQKEEGLTGEAIAGITIAVLCIVGLIVAIIVFLARRARQSGDISDGHMEKLKHIDNCGDGAKTPQVPKINTQELLNKHDQIMRYTNHPTSKKTSSTDNRYVRSSVTDTKIIEELGLAPQPPSNDYTGMQDRYDRLSMKDAQVPDYLPLQSQQDDLYQNTISVYMNTQQADPSGSTSRSKIQLNPTTGIRSNALPAANSQEAAEDYEAVGGPAYPAQEVYENNDSAALVRNEKEEQEDIYVNDGQGIDDDVYQNT